MHFVVTHPESEHRTRQIFRFSRLTHPSVCSVDIQMTSGGMPFRLWSEERATAGDSWDMKCLETITGTDSREAARL